MRKGSRQTEESKRKMSDFRKKHPTNYWLGKKRPDISLKKRGIPIQIGENHWNWKGGISKNQSYASFIEKRRELRKKFIGGSHSFGDWENLKAQYNWTCPACKKSEPEIKLTEDHIIPISKGGSDNIENVQPLCVSCNCRKSYKLIPKYNL